MESISNKKKYNLSFGIVDMINCCVASPSVCLHFFFKKRINVLTFDSDKLLLLSRLVAIVTVRWWGKRVRGRV